MDKWFKYILPDKDPYHNRGRDQMRKKGGPDFKCLWYPPPIKTNHHGISEMCLVITSNTNDSKLRQRSCYLYTQSGAVQDLSVMGGKINVCKSEKIKIWIYFATVKYFVMTHRKSFVAMTSHWPVNRDINWTRRTSSDQLIKVRNGHNVSTSIWYEMVIV
jgi:hypothetical protein